MLLPLVSLAGAQRNSLALWLGGGEALLPLSLHSSCPGGGCSVEPSAFQGLPEEKRRVGEGLGNASRVQ